MTALMRATKCEDPADLPRCQAAFERLYKIQEFRSILDLIATDAMRPRDPDNGGGVRIFIANDDGVGRLYAGGKGPQGAYDDGAHVLHMANRGANDLAGVIAHEMTHAAVRLITGDRATVPFTPGQPNETEYRNALAGDVKGLAMLMPKQSEADRKLLDRHDGRMDQYFQERLKMDQEFIVGISQMMAEFGPEEVKKLSPQLSRYLLQTVNPLAKRKTTNIKAAGGLGTIDDTSLQNLPNPTFKTQPMLDTDNYDPIQLALEMTRKAYQADKGTPRADRLIRSVNDFTLSGQDQQMLDACIQRMQKMLRRTVKENGLPEGFAPDSVRSLAVMLNDMVKTTANNNDPRSVDDLVETHATNWIRATKLEYIKRQSEAGVQVSDNVLAEGIVIQAENLAWMDARSRDTTAGVGTPEVDSGKHSGLIKAPAIRTE